MRDYLVPALLLLAFATFVTVHVALSFKLAFRRKPWWHGAAALVLPPLAPLLAHRATWRRWAFVWLGAVAVYAALLLAAHL